MTVTASQTLTDQYPSLLEIYTTLQLSLPTDELRTGLDALVLGLTSEDPKKRAPPPPAPVSASADSETWCTLPEVTFVNPRGSFSVDFGPGFVELRGKTGTHRVEKVDKLVQFVDKTGGSVFFRDASKIFLATLKGNNTGKSKAVVAPGCDAQLAQRFAGFGEVSRLDLFANMAAMSLGVEANIPTLFLSSKKEPFFSCNYKDVNEGRLYPLDDGLLFVGKPTLFIPIEEVHVLEVGRTQSKVFEIHVIMVTPEGSKNLAHDFSLIDNNELPIFQNYEAKMKFGKKVKKSVDAQNTSAASSSTSASKTERNESDSEQDDDSGDSEDDDSEDSSYVSGESDEGEAEGSSDNEKDDKDAASASKSTAENLSKDGAEESERDDSSDDGTSEDEDMSGDDVAELVEEEEFKPDATDVIASGKKRRRMVGGDS